MTNAALTPHPPTGRSAAGATADCQDLLVAGIDMVRVVLAGDWEHPEMPAYYGRRLAPHQSGVAELARLQQRNGEDDGGK